jgi:hypothetical protein
MEHAPAAATLTALAHGLVIIAKKMYLALLAKDMEMILSKMAHAAQLRTRIVIIFMANVILLIV